MRQIDADKFVLALMDASLSSVDEDTILDLVDTIPTIDAVPVVRCRNCKWYEPCTDWGFDESTGKRDHSKIIKLSYGECHGQDFVFGEDGFLRVGENDFCSCGEVKLDG